MASLVKKYQVKVVAHYYTTNDIEDVTREEAEELGWKEFYDESHRAEIYDTSIEDEWTDCNECGEGYTEQDVEKALSALRLTLVSLDPKTAPRWDKDKIEAAREETAEGLATAIDFFEGLIEEGRV